MKTKKKFESSPAWVGFENSKAQPILPGMTINVVTIHGLQAHFNRAHPKTM